jgi:hypothetical protein
MAGAKVSKNQLKSSGKAAVSEGNVKYDDPRMAYMSTKKEMIIKESETLKMKDIFGEDIVCKNAPVVLCEDHLGFYLTSKVNIDVPMLDGYRMYRRNDYTIVKNEDETFKVTKNNVEFVI